MRVRNTVAAGCGLAVLAGCSPATVPRPRTTAAAVVRVIDGDTLVLRRSGRAERARLIGVDAPEVWSRRDCFGGAAARALRRRTPPGASVRVAGDREKYDRYGRRLVYLWAARFVNADLIRAGFARAMVVRPNDRFRPLLRSAEATARRRHRGLWRACR